MFGEPLFGGQKLPRLDVISAKPEQDCLPSFSEWSCPSRHHVAHRRIRRAFGDCGHCFLYLSKADLCLAGCLLLRHDDGIWF